MSSNTDTSTAGFLVGRRREAACLPKETIFESTEGCLGEPDDKVIREPMATRPFGVEAWWTKMRSYDDVPFPDIDDDRLIEPHDSIGFD